MGWFEHGSTILVFVPPGLALADGIESGKRIRMGESLLQRLSISHRQIHKMVIQDMPTQFYLKTEREF